MGSLWREESIKLFLRARHSMYEKGDIDKDVTPLKDPVIVDLFKAELAYLTGGTSCGWFFPEPNRIEREITIENIKTAAELLRRNNIPTSSAVAA